MQTYQKKPSTQTQSQNITLPNLTTISGSIPNSAILSMLRIANGETNDLRQESGANVTERMSTLRENILSRMSRAPIRPQAQIPSAEAEADRLSANVSAASPEGVKRDLGRRMGADFSGVRFHTDEGAAAKADAMGARAFTSGADVYFGEGGFDPAVAAHELVHTAQQGMVTAGIETMSTPVGGVQMASTKISRKQHDKIDTLYQAMTTKNSDGKSDWSLLSRKERTHWKEKHKGIYDLVKNAINGDDTAEEKITKRIAKRQEEVEQAKAFLAGRKNQPKTSMLTRDAQGQWKIGVDAAAINPADSSQALSETNAGIETEARGVHDTLDQMASSSDLFVGTTTDGVAGTALDIATDRHEGNVALGTSGKVFSGFNGAFNTLQHVYGLANDGISLNEAITSKDTRGIIDSSVSIAGNTSSLAADAKDLIFLLNQNVSETAGRFTGGAASILSGAASVYGGSREIDEGRKKAKAMKTIKKKLGDRENLEDNNLLLRDTAEQARKEGVRQQTEGAGQVATGAMDSLSGILELGGVTSAAGTALGMANTIAKVGFTAANYAQRKKMKKSVVGHALGITGKDIDAFMAENPGMNRHRAKQALMKAMGYTSGQRREAYADQTQKRAEYFTEKAHAQDEDAKDLMKGLGVEEEGGYYSAVDAAESMGLGKTRERILAKTDPLGAQIRKAKQNQAQNAAP